MHREKMYLCNASVIKPETHIKPDKNHRHLYVPTGNKKANKNTSFVVSLPVGTSTIYGTDGNTSIHPWMNCKTQCLLTHR